MIEPKTPKKCFFIYLSSDYTFTVFISILIKFDLNKLSRTWLLIELVLRSGNKQYHLLQIVLHIRRPIVTIEGKELLLLEEEFVIRVP